MMIIKKGREGVEMGEDLVCFTSGCGLEVIQSMRSLVVLLKDE